DNEGKMLTGFQDIAGQRYYFNKDGSLYTGWVHDKNNWYYYTDQGLFKGWLYVNNNWYWLDKNGVMLTGDQIINNVKYYFNENGAMHTGWLEKESLWYFYDSGGAMKTGWVFTGNLWYWLNDEGIMQTGYQTINGNQYYFNPNGSMYVGWHYKEGSWYYFGDYGMVRGWLTVNGNFYYLNQDGVMVTGDVTIDGEKYTFAGSGELISSENLRILESQILNYIHSNAYSGEIWSVSVISLSKPGRIDINNRQQQAASLTKLFVMGAVYENYESLVSRYGQSIIDSNLHYMITISDNNAWVNLVTWLGYGNYASGTSVVTTWAQNHGYTLTATYPYSYQNFSSSRDTAQIVADMYNGKLRYSDRMLNLLYQQTRRHKIPAGVPSGVLVGNKTGELADTENDTAIVHGSNCTYVLSVMCTSSKSAGHSQSMIRTISSIVYNYLNS
uniref:serine hydrolase n=1 Tax=Faecalicoccus pleomorphus TaxID=1323 RepID=UPI0022E932B6